MKDFLTAVKLGLYTQRFNLLAMVISCVSWVVFANFVENQFGKQYLDAVAYGLLGWYWLGGTVMPWVEKKLERYFG